MICEIEARRSLCRLSGFLRPSQRQRKRRSLANNCCGRARQLEQIIARHIAAAARRNLSPSAAIRSANLKNEACRRPRHRWSNPRGKRVSYRECAANQTAYWLELLRDGGIVSSEKLAALRQECGELIAIFVTTFSSRSTRFVCRRN